MREGFFFLTCLHKRGMWIQTSDFRFIKHCPNRLRYFLETNERIILRKERSVGCFGEREMEVHWREKKKKKKKEEKLMRCNSKWHKF
jgi:hypothetical protein